MATDTGMEGAGAAPPQGGVEAPAPAPAPAMEPAVAAAAAPESAPVVEAAPAPAADAATAEQPSSEEPQAEAPAPEGEAKPEGEGDKPADAAAQAPEAPEARTYEAFTLPEGIAIDAPTLGAFTNILGKYGLTQEGGQELVDFHLNLMQQQQDRLAQAQHDAFAETRRGWVNEVTKRFGNRANTMVEDAKWAIEQFQPNKDARAKLWSVLGMTGAGDNPEMIELFARAAKKIRERPSTGPTVPNDPTRALNAADRRYRPRGG